MGEHVRKRRLELRLTQKQVDERLGVRTLRGHESPGMLCSAIELGVGEDADGILILEEGTPGQALAEALPMDTVFDLDITTNRPDCLCHVGIARELRRSQLRVKQITAEIGRISDRGLSSRL